MKAFAPFLLTFALIIFISAPAIALDPIYTATFSKTAVSGYDTVAYFTEDEAVEGSDEFKTQYKGARWKFSSAENLEKFKANPEQYMPQFGGYCAYAVSQGVTASSDPEQWSIQDGKLYLNYNADIKKRWTKDRDDLIEAANANWPVLLNDGRPGSN